MPKFEFVSHAKPSVFAYPAPYTPPVKETVEKVKTAVLSTTVRANARMKTKEKEKGSDAMETVGVCSPSSEDWMLTVISDSLRMTSMKRLRSQKATRRRTTRTHLQRRTSRHQKRCQTLFVSHQPSSGTLNSPLLDDTNRSVKSALNLRPPWRLHAQPDRLPLSSMCRAAVSS